MSDEDIRLLTVPEAAEALRIGRWMANKLIQSGELASLKIGARRLIRPEAIAAFAAEREAEASAEREEKIQRFRRRVGT